MGKYRKLTHVVYKCDYHIVFVPKYRFRILTGEIKQFVEESIRLLCEWKQVEIEEMNVQKDHVHLLVSIPPKVSVSNFMGIIKGKTAIKLFKGFPKMRKKPYWGNHFWARGYFVSTVGINEELIRRYIKHQEKEERRLEKERMEYSLF